MAEFDFMDDMFASKKKKKIKKKEEKITGTPMKNVSQEIKNYVNRTVKKEVPKKKKTQTPEKKIEKPRINSISDVSENIKSRVSIDHRGRVHINDIRLFEITPFVLNYIENDIVLERFRGAVIKISSSYGDSSYNKRVSKTNYETIMSIIKSIETDKMTKVEKEMVRNVLKDHDEIKFMIKYRIEQSIEENERGDVLYLDEF